MSGNVYMMYKPSTVLRMVFLRWNGGLHLEIQSWEIVDILGVPFIPPLFAYKQIVCSSCLRIRVKGHRWGQKPMLKPEMTQTSTRCHRSTLPVPGRHAQPIAELD